MASIHIDEQILSLLKIDAVTHGVAIEARAAQILRAALEPRATRLALLQEANRIANMTPKDILQTPSEVLLREDRDR